MSIASSPISSVPIGSGPVESTAVAHNSNVGAIASLASALVVFATLGLTAPVVASGSADVSRTNNFIVSGVGAPGGGECAVYYAYWGKKIQTLTTLVVAGGGAVFKVEQFPATGGKTVGATSSVFCIKSNLIQVVHCIGGGSANPFVRVMTPVTGSVKSIGSLSSEKISRISCTGAVGAISRIYSSLVAINSAYSEITSVCGGTNIRKILTNGISDTITAVANGAAIGLDCQHERTASVVTVVAAPSSEKTVKALYQSKIHSTGKGYSDWAALPSLASNITAVVSGGCVYSVSVNIGSVITVATSGSALQKYINRINSDITAVVTSSGWYAQRDYNTSDGGGLSGGSSLISVLHVQRGNHVSIIEAVGYGMSDAPGFIFTQHVYLSSKIDAVGLPYIESIIAIYTQHEYHISMVNAVASSSAATIYPQVFFKALVVLVADDIPTRFVVEDI